MPWQALVETDTQLARILGVSRQAIAKAEARGLLVRAADGRWDVMLVVDRWRLNTNPLLQRSHRAREFRPWLDPEIPLTASVWDELVRRADAAGVEWQRS